MPIPLKSLYTLSELIFSCDKVCIVIVESFPVAVKPIHINPLADMDSDLFFVDFVRDEPSLIFSMKVERVGRNRADT